MLNRPRPIQHPAKDFKVYNHQSQLKLLKSPRHISVDARRDIAERLELLSPQKNVNDADKFIAGALKLIEQGHRVFPITAGQKFPPLIDDCYRDATSSILQVAEWWAKWPDANVGMLVEGYLVIEVNQIEVRDTDGKVIGTRPNDWDGLQLFDHIMCRTSTTPSGGKQYFLKMPKGQGLRLPQRRLADGVMAYSDGSYVLAPPSVVNGK